MIREIIKAPNNRYGRFFLSTEAPGDEQTDDSSTIKANTKVITVKPNNRNRIDFTSGADEIPEDNELTDDTNDENMNSDDISSDVNEPDLGSDDVDFTSDDAPVDNQPQEDTNLATDTEILDNTDGNNTDATSTEPVVQDGDNPDNTDVSPEDGPDLGADDVDFTSDDADDGSGTDGEITDDTSASEQPAEDEQQKGPGLEYDSTRKYKLFQNYMSLLNALDNYTAKLESRLCDDYTTNKIFHKAIDQLQDIRDLAFDFVTMKFEISTYVQSLLFYENLIVMIQLVFEFIEKSFSMLKPEKNN